jgi:hypothetical protein
VSDDRSQTNNGQLRFAPLAEPDQAEIARFRANGILIVEGVLDHDRIAALRDRFPKLFTGQFGTGIRMNGTGARA